MPYLPEFLTIALIHILAAMAPGPDFAMVSRNSVLYSRKVGIYSALGLGLGILVHVTYSLVGIGFVIAKSIVLFSIIKFLGAGYLIYIGYKSLRSKKAVIAKTQTTAAKKELDNFASIKLGFLTNVLNPKVTLFFLSLFTQVINPETPLMIQIFYGLYMSLATFVWFTIVAMIFSHKSVKGRISFVQHYIEKAFGAILIALGVKIALSSK